MTILFVYFLKDLKNQACPNSIFGDQSREAPILFRVEVPVTLLLFCYFAQANMRGGSSHLTYQEFRLMPLLEQG